MCKDVRVEYSFEMDEWIFSDEEIPYPFLLSLSDSQNWAKRPYPAKGVIRKPKGSKVS